MRFGNVVAITSLVIVFGAGLQHAHAEIDPQLLKLAAAVYSAVDKARGALGDINAVEAVVKDIEAGKKPSVTENKWTPLADHYKAAADEIRRAPLPTEFDKSKYAFSLAELQNCDTRANAIAKAKGLLAELTEAQKRGTASLAALDAGSAHVTASRAALKYLIDVHAKLVTVPIYGEIFKWDWFVLQTDISSSLGDFDSALDGQRKRLVVEMKKIELYVSNLASNLAGLEKLSCSLEGRWKGTATADGETIPVEVVVTKTGNEWAGGATLAGEGATLRDVRVNGKTITFVVAVDDDVIRFTGTMSQDGFALSGSFTYPDGNGTFTTKRQ